MLQRARDEQRQHAREGSVAGAEIKKRPTNEGAGGTKQPYGGDLRRPVLDVESHRVPYHQQYSQAQQQRRHGGNPLTKCQPSPQTPPPLRVMLHEINLGERSQARGEVVIVGIRSRLNQRDEGQRIVVQNIERPAQRIQTAQFIQPVLGRAQDDRRYRRVLAPLLGPGRGLFRHTACIQKHGNLT
jgi:hypothetical protein